MKKRASCRILDYKYPASDNIGHRTTTVARAMACTLLKRVSCTAADEKKWSEYFGCTCAYCGKKATHLDHLYPLIENKRPTGYFTEPANLVPCCGTCNQAKGNRNYLDFMNSDDCEHVGDDQTTDPDQARARRILNMEAFILDMKPTKMILDDETLAIWDETYEAVVSALQTAQQRLVDKKQELISKE